MKILLFIGLLVALLVSLRLLSRRPTTTARSGPAANAMSPEEALAILGLEPTHADKDAVIEAHRRLMQKLHPDKGGSAHLARQLNEAKRVLLQRP